MSSAPEHRFDPPDVLEGLARSTDPLLVGVRHHSSACAAAIAPILDAFRPDCILVELPAEFAPWLPWLGHPGARAPLALGAVCGPSLAFYPFADFSPELEVIRWAVRSGVPCEPFDLPIARRSEEEAEKGAIGAPEPGDHAPHRIHGALLALVSAPDHESLWDQLVEAPAAGGDPEQTRRAALLYGWALRADAGTDARGSDLARERFMRERIAAARAGGARRITTVVGAFHAAALLDDAAADPLPRLPPIHVHPIHVQKTGPEVVTSLLPYGFEQLDSRSGYPAGIRDPQWHQRVFHAIREAKPVDGVLGEVVVEVCRRIRSERHVAGTPDATEALRTARGLAALRDLPAPGRRELLEGVQLALGHGELLGRGRVVARALDHVMVGHGRGRLADGTPRSGLAPHVEGLFAALRLPGPDATPSTEPLRLDPLRSEIDRRRHVTLHRTSAAGVSYAEPIDTDDENLTSVWQVAWTAATEATLAAASLRGVTLEQAAAGAIRARTAALDSEDKLTAGIRIDLLSVSAECGLPDLVRSGLREMRDAVAREAGLAELVRAIALVERIAHGHLPGCPVDPARIPKTEPGAVQTVVLADGVLGEVRDELLAAAVRAVDGLHGSDDAADLAALVSLVRVFEQAPERLGDGRLAWALERLAELGTPRMQGGAGGARVLLGTETPAVFGERIGSWVDACSDAGSRTLLAGRLRGTLAAVGPQLEGHPALLRPLLLRIAALDDTGFLSRLPALRDGFDVLSPAARDRLLQVVSEQIASRDGAPTTAELDHDPVALASFAGADLAGLEILTRLALAPEPVARATPGPARPLPEGDTRLPADPSHRVGGRDRWRLMLGRQRRNLDAHGRRYARALDELYGQGRGEGSRGGIGGKGGGTEDPFPSVREWSDDLAELFGGQLRQEVLGRAAERGDPNALLELDPNEVQPSVQLLEQVLSLKGGLSEAQLVTLRRIVERVVRSLLDELAVRIRPAMSGISVPRPTRRRTGRLDLRRTIDANLRTVRLQDGAPQLLPDRLVFRTRGKRSMDWRIVLVVDTSGSMDSNVIHSAMMSAILSGLPAVSLHFVAFSTQVVDLSDRVDDPLGLLLEVRVGGGTDIGKAVRYARSLVTSPTRTICVVVSDFEEGAPVRKLVSEVRTMVESGVKMLGLAALDDHARPSFNVGIAEMLVAAGMPVAALSPLELARWVGEQIR